MYCSILHPTLVIFIPTSLFFQLCFEIRREQYPAMDFSFHLFQEGEGAAICYTSGL